MQVFELVACLQVGENEASLYTFWDFEVAEHNTGITDVDNEEVIPKALADCQLDFDIDLNATEPGFVEEQ
ncbi:hypothetical protein PS15m_008578 [Mucor circinelloides]